MQEKETQNAEEETTAGRKTATASEPLGRTSPELEETDTHASTPNQSTLDPTPSQAS